MDTSDESFCDKREKYLLKTLKNLRNSYRRCFIVTHTPPICPESLNGYFNKDFAAKLEKIVKQFDITGLICGHLHIAEKLNFKGVPVYISHASGQKIRDMEHPYFGYLKLHFKSDGSVTENYIYKPELKRSRNYFYGYILENIYGNFIFLISSSALLFLGLFCLSAALCITRRMNTQKHLSEQVDEA